MEGKRREWDSNPRWSFPHTRFPSVLLKPLGHLSEAFRLYHKEISFQSSDAESAGRFFGHAGEETVEFADKVFQVQPGCGAVTRLQVSNRFPELTARSDGVPPAQMVQTHGGLNEALITRPERQICRRSPQVFPNFVSVVELPVIK